MWPGHQWIMDWVVVINCWLRALHIKHCHEIQPHNSRWELSDKCIMTWRLCVTGLMMCDISKNNQSCDNFSVSYWTFGVVCYFIYYRNSNNLKEQCINIVMMWSHSTYQPVLLRNVVQSVIIITQIKMADHGQHCTITYEL